MSGSAETNSENESYTPSVASVQEEPAITPRRHRDNGTFVSTPANEKRQRTIAQDDTVKVIVDTKMYKFGDRLDVSETEVVNMNRRLSGSDQSLNAPISETGEDDWQDFLADERPSPEAVVTGMRDASTRSKWLAEALAELSPRERTIIDQRRLSEEGATLEELGRELGVSKERVRQLEHRALMKLRDRLVHRVERTADLLLEA